MSDKTTQGRPPLKPLVLNERQAAALVKRSLSTVRHWRETRWLPWVRLSPRRVGYFAEDLHFLNGGPLPALPDIRAGLERGLQGRTMLNAAEVSRLTGLAPRTVWVGIKGGWLPAVVDGPYYHVRACDLVDWLLGRRVGATETPRRRRLVGRVDA